MTTCLGCGKTLASRYASRCGACRRTATAIARAEGYVYRNVHIHDWGDGRLTVERGVECACEESEGAA